jgi:hypothetical protein
MHHTVTLELGSEKLTISVSRPAQFETYEQFALATYSHALHVRNFRGFRHDDLDQLAQLGEQRAFVQAALTDHPTCAWVGEDNASTPYRTRQALSNSGWLKILHHGGARAILRVVDTFIGLWPSDD